MIFFTSDLHLGHPNIIKDFSRRNFQTIEDHDNHIIDQLNKYVGPKDILWHLGDFAWPAKIGGYKNRIKCKQMFVIRGNHDKKNALEKNFKVVCDTKEIKLDGHKVFMSHYPHLYWPSSHYGSIHLYGHLHYYREDLIDKMMPDRRSMDVGIDAAFHKFGEYRPFTEKEVLELLSKPGHHNVEYEREKDREWEQKH